MLFLFCKNFVVPDKQEEFDDTDNIRTVYHRINKISNIEIPGETAAIALISVLAAAYLRRRR